MLCDCYDTQYDIICARYGLLGLKAWKRYDMIDMWHEWYDMIDMQNNELVWNTTRTYTKNCDKWYKQWYEKWYDKYKMLAGLY